MSLNHVPAARQFRLPVEGSADAYIEYVERGPTTLDLLHTVVPDEAQGQGIGTDLVDQVLRHARENGLHIVPSCPFVATYLENHPDQADLVAS